MSETISTKSVTQPTKWFQIMLLVCAGTVAAFQIGKVPPVLTAIQKELNMNLIMAGWVLSSFNVIGVMISPLAGGIADVFGHKRIILTGFACLAVGSFSGGFSNHTYFLLASRILEGLGYIFVVVSIPGLLILLVSEQDRSVAFGFWSCFLPAGGSLMMVLSPFLIRLFNWRGIWLVNAGLAVGIAILISVTINQIKHSYCSQFSIRQILPGISQTLRTPGIMILTMSFLLFSFQFLTLIGFLPKIIVEQNEVSAETAALVTACILAIHIPGNLLGGWLLNRNIHRWKILCLSQVLVGLGGCIQFFPIILSIRLICGICFAIGGGMIATVVFSGVAVMAPKPYLVGTSNGVAMQGAQIGLLTGPPLTALMVSINGDWTHSLILLIPVAAAGILLSVVLKRFPDRT